MRPHAIGIDTGSLDLMPLAPGVKFGGYEVVAPIGAGGMGARGRRVERLTESRRASTRGGGAPRHFLKTTPSPCR
ncbi:MAG TPA: hypothetical protein VES67_02505 [Vicinamibacterales bacterium]|nr:hypothetical protein [Vicinamibacterales bacterium]